MLVDYNSIHEPEYTNINERISPNLKLYLNRLKQHVPNINIRLYGSITNFTHFKNKSDVDCFITYSDEYTKNKLIQFVTEDSLQFKIKRINVQQLKFSSLNHKDEFADVYCVYFDNGDKIDFTLIYGDFGPLIKLQHHVGIIYMFFLYIIKWLYYYANIISKDLFIYLKKKMFVVKDYFSNMTVTVLHKTNIKVSDSDSS
jgi:predicted nucleotidyltransferase